MQQSIVKVLIATLYVVALLDILTHGNAAVAISQSFFGGWGRILQVLTGTAPSGGFPQRSV